jgi:hypothetical protein
MKQLFTMMPFADDLNLGRAYNEAMALLPEDAWCALIDHDAMFTTKRWFSQLQEAIAARPDAGVFTCVTNRIAASWQRVGPWAINEDNDPAAHQMAEHYRIGEERLKVRTLLDVTDTKGFGGVLMCLSKATWRAVGGFPDGLLCVDHGMHFGCQRIGKRVWLMENLYLYHRRRAFGGYLPEGTPKAAHCPCRGPEKQPTVRVVLP